MPVPVQDRRSDVRDFSLAQLDTQRHHRRHWAARQPSRSTCRPPTRGRPSGAPTAARSTLAGRELVHRLLASPPPPSRRARSRSARRPACTPTVSGQRRALDADHQHASAWRRAATASTSAPTARTATASRSPTSSRSPSRWPPPRPAGQLRRHHRFRASSRSTDINSNAITGRAVTGVFPIPTTQTLRRAQRRAPHALVRPSRPQESTPWNSSTRTRTAAGRRSTSRSAASIALIVARDRLRRAPGQRPDLAERARRDAPGGGRARDIAGRKPIEEGDVVDAQRRPPTRRTTNAFTALDEVLGPGDGRRRSRPGSSSPGTCSPRPPRARRSRSSSSGEEYDPSGPDMRAVA